MDDTLRIEEAKRSLFQWCIKSLPVYRKVTKEDVEGIERVKESNIQSRKKLFGGSHKRWYS